VKPAGLPQDDTAALDLFAWQAIKGWPQAAGYDPIHEGLDFEELTRWSLWDKVGRAIRAGTDPEAFAFEERIVLHRGISAGAIRSEWLAPSAFMAGVRRFISVLGDRLGRGGSARARNRWDKPTIYVPFPSPRLEPSVAGLARAGYPLILSGPSPLQEYDGCRISQLPAGAWGAYDRKFAGALQQAICEGLSRQGVRLLDYDMNLLERQIVEQLCLLRMAEAELATYRPKALLLHGDNHPPYQPFAAVAKRCGVWTVAMQHGLDCERYYLDDAYANAVAVWSDHRKRRYEQDSGRQPALLQVTGNPAFDKAEPLPVKIDATGDYLLWITRPHTPRYCYSPSRQPKEGLDILAAILAFMEKNQRLSLVIKPHPGDYAHLYRDRVAASPLASRTVVSEDGLPALVRNARVVVSEDTTGGLDAMLRGKILIHSHFSASAPILPFCGYKAALPGFSPEEMVESLARAERLSVMEREEMHAGQRRFIADFAGPLDGLADERRRSFLENILSGKGL
jgi:hypothetical protein